MERYLKAIVIGRKHDTFWLAGVLVATKESDSYKEAAYEELEHLDKETIALATRLFDENCYDSCPFDTTSGDDKDTFYSYHEVTRITAS